MLLIATSLLHAIYSNISIVILHAINSNKLLHAIYSNISIVILHAIVTNNL